VSRDSSVSIVTGKELDDRGVGVESWYDQEVYLFQVILTGSCAHPVSVSLAYTLKELTQNVYSVTMIFVKVCCNKSWNIQEYCWPSFVYMATLRHLINTAEKLQRCHAHKETDNSLNQHGR
jgi:hypothetical protein